MHLPELYKNFGFGSAIAEDREHLSYVAQIGEGVRLLALNCDFKKKGNHHFKEEQFEWIKKQAEKAREDGQMLFAMNHYPILGGQPLMSLIEPMSVRDSYKTASFLADNGIHLVFTGYHLRTALAKVHHFAVATAAIKEMVAQVGPVVWQGDKIIKGVIIRHLILPGQINNSLAVLDWIGENFKKGEVLVSLMRQYTPMPGMPEPFDRTITEEEYDAVLSWMMLNDLDGFTQEATAADILYIPNF